jgi:hypothetical protein
MTGGIVTVENLTYTQIKEMMIQRWEFIKALRLNEKSNKGKEKVVEEKEKSRMKTVLNAFKRDGRERESRDRGERGERERGARVDSTQTLNTTQSKPQPSSTTTQHNSTNSPSSQQTKLNKMKCWNCEEEGHGAWDCSKNLKQLVRIRMKKAQQRKLEREKKKRDSSSKSGKKHFMHGLVNKTYIGEPTTTSSLQSQDFVDTLMVMDTRKVDGVERKSLDTEQYQERCINTLSQRLCSLLSENLTEKVILNLTDCDSLSNHVTAKITDEKVISLTESDALSNQHDVLDAAEHAPAYGNEFGTCGVKFSMGDDFPTLVSPQRNEYS